MRLQINHDKHPGEIAKLHAALDLRVICRIRCAKGRVPVRVSTGRAQRGLNDRQPSVFSATADTHEALLRTRAKDAA